MQSREFPRHSYVNKPVPPSPQRGQPAFFCPALATTKTNFETSRNSEQRKTNSEKQQTNTKTTTKTVLLVKKSIK
jgi:hypothetical protein